MFNRAALSSDVALAGAWKHANKAALQGRPIHGRCLRRTLLGLCSALAFSSGAAAQVVPPGANAPETASGQPLKGAAGGSDPHLNPTDSGSAPQTNAVAEIVVTAQKREQRLSEVPITVTAVSGDTLKKQGITDVTQLQYTAPELVFTAGPSPAYSIRGIGTQTFSRTASSDVSVVLDGVIQGQPEPPTNSLFDIQRVEILSGPQGMLFGKNASAGVINIVTNAPDPKATSFTGHADVGNRGYQVYQGTANLPVTADSALRISAFSNGEGSTLHNVYGDRDVNAFTDYGARARYLWAPGAFTLNVIADYEKNNGNSPTSTLRSATTLEPILAACGVTPGPHNTNVCIDGPSALTFENYGLSAQVDVPLGAYTLTSITADRQFRFDQNLDTDQTNLNLLDTNIFHEIGNQGTEELRLTSPAGKRLEYVTGLYYFNFLYKVDNAQAGTLGVFPVQVLGDAPLQHLQETSYAAFGQGSFRIYRGLKLVFGARETRDITSVNDSFQCKPEIGLCIPGFTAAGVSTGHIANDNFSYRAGAQYQIDRNNEIYATYTRGYKGPAFNTPFFGQVGTSSVRPEIPLYLEVGAKTAYFDRRLTIDLVGFHDVVKDFQAQVLDESVTPAVFRFTNASRLTSDGVQLDVATHPINGLTLGGGFLYNHAVYGNFLTQCSPGACTGAINVKGQQLASAPRWSATLNSEYDWSFTSRLGGYVNASVSYRGESNSLGQPDPNVEIASYAIVNGRIGVRTADGRYGLAVFARNLFDNRFPAIIYSDPISGGLNYDQAFSRDAFRVVGVSLDVHY